MFLTSALYSKQRVIVFSTFALSDCVRLSLTYLCPWWQHHVGGGAEDGLNQPGRVDNERQVILDLTPRRPIGLGSHGAFSASILSSCC